MLSVAPQNFPEDLPEGAFHVDADDELDYRLPRTLQADYFLFKGDINGGERWLVRENARASPVALTTAMVTAAIGFAKDRRILTLEADNQALIEHLARAPAAAAAPAATNTQRVQLGKPRHFTGVPNDKGVYDPSPRVFVTLLQNYMSAQEIELGPLSEQRKIADAATFLDEAAAEWYLECLEEAHDPADDYDGPLTDFHSFLEGLRRQFEDIDIKSTAQHKIKILKQGKLSAEEHVRIFKQWARHTAFNDEALVSDFKTSLNESLRNKVVGQGKARPTTLKGWYDDVIIFDRAYREEHPERFERSAARSSTSDNHSGQSSRNNQSSQPPRQNPSWPRFQPNNANQQQPRNGTFRAWGIPTQPAVPPRANNNNGPVPMDIDATSQHRQCYRCGKFGHISRGCNTPVAEIRQQFGRDSMYPPPQRIQAIEMPQFGSASEFVNALSPEAQQQLEQAMAARSSSSSGSSSSNSQGFASGSS